MSEDMKVLLWGRRSVLLTGLSSVEMMAECWEQSWEVVMAYEWAALTVQKLGKKMAAVTVQWLVLWKVPQSEYGLDEATALR